MSAFVKYTKKARLLRSPMRAIAALGPDEPLGSLSDEVPTLCYWGWLRIIRHSDGDYIEITERGRKWAR